MCVCWGGGGHLLEQGHLFYSTWKSSGGGGTS